MPLQHGIKFVIDWVLALKRYFRGLQHLEIMSTYAKLSGERSPSLLLTGRNLLRPLWDAIDSAYIDLNPLEKQADQKRSS